MNPPCMLRLPSGYTSACVTTRVHERDAARPNASDRVVYVRDEQTPCPTPIPSSLAMFNARERFSDIKENPGQVKWHSSLKYPFRLNLLVLPSRRGPMSDVYLCSYDKPPLEDITIEEFETCAIDRLRVLAEIESSFARNRPYDELKAVTLAQCQKYLPLHSSTASTVDRDAERRKDHIGHFVLRLAFCRSCVTTARIAVHT